MKHREIRYYLKREEELLYSNWNRGKLSLFLMFLYLCRLCTTMNTSDMTKARLVVKNKNNILKPGWSCFPAWNHCLRRRVVGLFILIFFFLTGTQSKGQQDSLLIKTDSSLHSDTVMLFPDSRGKIPLTFADSLDRSVELVKRYVHNDRFWKYDQEPYRKALLRLIWYLESNPVDSVVEYLKSFPYPLAVPEPKPQDSSQVIPEVLPSNTGSVNVPDSLSEAREKVDSLVVADSLVTRMPDSLALVTPDSINPDTISVDSLIHTEDSISKQNGVKEEHFDIFRDTLYTVYCSDTLPLYISDTGYVASMDTLR